MIFIANSNFYLLLIFTLYLLAILEYSKDVDAFTLDDIDIDDVNTNYINVTNMNVTIHRKKKTVDMEYELIKDFPPDVTVRVDVSTRAFGYEVPNILKFEARLCDSRKGQIVFRMFYSPVGVEDCPPKKGIYRGKDLNIDFSQVSVPMMSGARLMFIIRISGNGDVTIVQFKAFVLT